MRVHDFACRANVPADSMSAAMMMALPHAVVVDADAVARWFYEQRRGADGTEVLKLIDRCVPPFECAMVEYREMPNRPEHVGCMVWRDYLDVGYRLHFFVWLSNLRDSISSIQAVPSVDVAENGTPDWDTFSVNAPQDATEEQIRHTIRYLAVVIATALLTFRFMHARGVEVRDTQPSRADRRRAVAEGRPAPVTFKTLDIAPMEFRLSKEGDVERNGIARALHLCRGHFADYTKGAGLFGKYKCEVFVPEHVKGRAQKGVVVKDYAVTKLVEERGDA